MHKPEEELELITDPSAWGFKARPNWVEAQKEMENLIDMLKSEGVRIELIDVGSDVPPPNLYFTKDLGVCTLNGLILSYFRHEYRQGEELFLESMSDKLNIPIFGRIMNGYFEGGDLIQVNDDTIAIGLNHRTNKDGFEQVCEFFNKTILPVFHNERTHLDSIFGVIDESLAVVYEPSLPKEFIDFLTKSGFELLTMTEKEQQAFASDFLLLESDKVVLGEDCAELAGRLEDSGVDVIPANIIELKKGNGGPGSFALTLLRK